MLCCWCRLLVWCHSHVTLLFSATGLVSFPWYICYCRILVWCHSGVMVLVSATVLVSFWSYIISVGYWYGVIPMLYYLCRLLVWCHSHVILLVPGTRWIIQVLHYWCRLMDRWYFRILFKLRHINYMSFNNQINDIIGTWQMCRHKCIMTIL